MRSEFTFCSYSGLENTSINCLVMSCLWLTLRGTWWLTWWESLQRLRQVARMCVDELESEWGAIGSFVPKFAAHRSTFRRIGARRLHWALWRRKERCEIMSDSFAMIRLLLSVSNLQYWRTRLIESDIINVIELIPMTVITAYNIVDCSTKMKTSQGNGNKSNPRNRSTYIYSVLCFRKSITS